MQRVVLNSWACFHGQQWLTCIQCFAHAVVFMLAFLFRSPIRTEYKVAFPYLYNNRPRKVIYPGSSP
jgi:hypothetical protein